MIQGVFYSEFDNIAGPQIVYQAPQNALSNEVFDSVSGYIIIDKALCGKIITVCPQDIKIVGYPVCIEDDKYHRNALLFNIGFVFDKDADAAPYKPILRKLGALMESMEKEMGFLSKESTKATLSTILPSILHDLTMYGESTTTIDPANIINLKVFQKLPPPPDVFEHQVPVAIRDLHDLLKNSVEWDLALQKIVPHIDGVNYVKRIAIAAEVDVAIVKNCMRQLLFYGCITMIDIFMHSNIYATTSAVHSLVNDLVLQQECIAYIGYANEPAPSFSAVFSLYCALQPNTPVAHVWKSHHKLLAHIDVRRLITFGLIHGILRRIHRYPVIIDRLSSRPPQMLSSSPSTVSLQSATLTNGSNAVMAIRKAATPHHGNNGARSPLIDREAVKKMMDGEHHTDEICCVHMIRYSDLERLLEGESCCYVLK
ncbi:hypothetical protein, variant 1 [Aphanomyces invadans]|uniref:Nitrogen permease regulator 2 n=1 Tax=Aphanomyces invadans TaxID=157072 RepID=A0A024UJU5_9STRA|nr:hypothetical protein, variant 1 [Aphanomyces invadans]ETW06726.1 hypothetical protein, variant 1 [Aphanomyces invadans]|eukprot:XP_008864801.1 hypothetical protein, variant 1 [Aphanomyces invadans]